MKGSTSGRAGSGDEVISDQHGPDDGGPDEGMGFVPHPPISVRFLHKDDIGDLDPQDGEHVENNVADGKIPAQDHVEEKEPDEQLDLMKSLDMNPDPPEMAPRKEQARKDHGENGVEAEPSLENNIINKTPEHELLDQGHQDGFAQDHENPAEADLDRMLKTSDAEEHHDEGVGDDDEKNEGVSQLDKRKILADKPDQVLKHDCPLKILSLNRTMENE
jgi:hypothetical protein